MILPLTTNAQAILLLTAPLITGGRDASADLLTLSEYNRLTWSGRMAKWWPAQQRRARWMTARAKPWFKN